MPRISGKFSIPKLQDQELSSDIEKLLIQHMRDAARDFIVAAFEVVPVQSGLAAGTFLNLAAALDETLSIAPVVFGLKHKQPGVPTVPKQPASGKHFEKSHLPKEGAVKFSFQVKLNYYNLHEFGFQQRAWESFERGRIAYLEKMKQIDQIELAGYIINTVVSFGPGNKGTVLGGKRLRRRKQFTVR